MKFFCDVIISNFDFEMWQDMDLSEAQDDTGCFLITLIDDKVYIEDPLDENGVLIELQSYDSLYIEGIIGYFEDFGHIEYLDWYEEHTDTYSDYMGNECEAKEVENVEDYCDVYFNCWTEKRSLLKVTRPCFGRYVPKTGELLVLVSE